MLKNCFVLFSLFFHYYVTLIQILYYILSVNAGNMRIVAGEHDLSQDSGLEQIRGVSSYTIHENYDAQTFENDIALIFVSHELYVKAIMNLVVTVSFCI